MSILQVYKQTFSSYPDLELLVLVLVDSASLYSKSVLRADSISPFYIKYSAQKITPFKDVKERGLTRPHSSHQ